MRFHNKAKDHFKQGLRIPIWPLSPGIKVFHVAFECLQNWNRTGFLAKKLENLAKLEELGKTEAWKAWDGQSLSSDQENQLGGLKLDPACGNTSVDRGTFNPNVLLPPIVRTVILKQSSNIWCEGTVQTTKCVSLQVSFWEAEYCLREAVCYFLY